jgi:drug/metabolite transporter (DMT)-like permease
MDVGSRRRAAASGCSPFIAYIFWNRGVDQVGASVAGLFVHLMPVFGTILAWLFSVNAVFHVAGIVLI